MKISNNKIKIGYLHLAYIFLRLLFLGILDLTHSASKYNLARTYVSVEGINLVSLTYAYVIADSGKIYFEY